MTSNGMKNSKDENPNLVGALGLAWELGYTIAIPIVVFALVGRFADTYFDTSPLLLLLGIFISIILTSWLVYKKTVKLLK